MHAAAKPDSPQEDVSQSPDGLPQYAAESAAFHEAFAAELRSVVDSLPLEPHMRVLDVGCGDGFYTQLLAERLGALGSSETGEVVAVDNNPNFLRAAEERIRRRRSESNAAPLAPVRFLEADLNQLAAESPIYDVAWCAQSLFSFPEPVSSLKKIRAALKPGGLVVVLENNTLHQLLLPWPTEQELIIRSAEFAALAAESKRPGKFYVGRRLPTVLAEAGFEPLGFTTQAIDRAAPLDEPHERFLRCYLQKLRERIEPHIDPADAAEFAEAIRPEGRNYVLTRPHFACTWINVIAVGRKP
jgi:ubiquinone/menaquinone biosynthesis C-methylase UbiE